LANKGKSGNILFTFGQYFIILMFRKNLYVRKNFFDPLNGTLSEIFLATGGGGCQNLFVSQKKFFGVVGHNPKKLGKFFSAPLIFPFPYAYVLNWFVASLLASCDNAAPTTCQQDVSSTGL
jgi:hypothetical protein